MQPDPKNQKRAKSDQAVLRKVNIKPVNSVDFRRRMVNEILNEINKSTLDPMQRKFIAYIMEIRPIKNHNKLFMSENNQN